MTLQEIKIILNHKKKTKKKRFGWSIRSQSTRGFGENKISEYIWNGCPIQIFFLPEKEKWPVSINSLYKIYWWGRTDNRKYLIYAEEQFIFMKSSMQVSMKKIISATNILQRSSSGVLIIFWRIYETSVKRGVVYFITMFKKWQEFGFDVLPVDFYKAYMGVLGWWFGWSFEWKYEWRTAATELQKGSFNPAPKKRRFERNKKLETSSICMFWL